MIDLIALLPIKHESERVPGKNFRVLGEQPLFESMLARLLTVRQVSRIVVNTDSPVLIESLAGRDRIDVSPRPQSLLGHRVAMTEIIKYEAERTAGEVFLQVHATSPFLQAETMSLAVDRFLAEAETDSVFGVTRMQTRLYTEDMEAINHDPAVLLPTQELPVIYEENSSMYVFGAALARAGRRIGDSPRPVEVGAFESFDIDTEADWEAAERMIKGAGQ